MNLIPIGSNQTEVEFDRGTHADRVRVLFSYSTPVAACVNGKFYRTEKKFSVTTSRHINQWLEGVNAEVKPQEFFTEITR